MSSSSLSAVCALAVCSFIDSFIQGNGLTDVSILARAVNVEILSLSVNKVSSLAAFRECRRLRELYLRKNNIASLKELVHLVKAARLPPRLDTSTAVDGSSDSTMNASALKDGVASTSVSDTLQVLFLSDNPCAKEEDYRGKIIALLPKLTKVRQGVEECALSVFDCLLAVGTRIETHENRAASTTLLAVLNTSD